MWQSLVNEKNTQNRFQREIIPRTSIKLRGASFNKHTTVDEPEYPICSGQSVKGGVNPAIVFGAIEGNLQTEAHAVVAFGQCGR